MDSYVIMFIMLFLLVSSILYFSIRQGYAVAERAADVLVFSGCGCSGYVGCVYADFSLWIRGTHVIVRGWFNESAVRSMLADLIDHAMKRYSLGFLDAVREIAVAWSVGNISGVGCVYIGWRSFTVMGGWCWGAVERATYILRMYNIGYIDITMKKPYHRILLLKNYTGEQVYVEGYGLWSVYINFPETPIPNYIRHNDTWRTAVFAPSPSGWYCEGLSGSHGYSYYTPTPTSIFCRVYCEEY